MKHWNKHPNVRAKWHQVKLTVESMRSGRLVPPRIWLRIWCQRYPSEGRFYIASADGPMLLQFEKEEDASAFILHWL